MKDMIAGLVRSRQQPAALVNCQSVVEVRLPGIQDFAPASIKRIASSVDNSMTSCITVIWCMAVNLTRFPVCLQPEVQDGLECGCAAYQCSAMSRPVHRAAKAVKAEIRYLMDHARTVAK